MLFGVRCGGARCDAEGGGGEEVGVCSGAASDFAAFDAVAYGLVE